MGVLQSILKMGEGKKVLESFRGDPFALGAVREACETIRRHAVKLLEALWDAEYQRREEDGLSLATFEKLRRAQLLYGAHGGR